VQKQKGLIPASKVSRKEKEKLCLMRLIEYYITTGKAVGSNTLREVGFPDLSSATLRNYFASLEEEGYLTQQHISGGRIPTKEAFCFFAKECLEEVEREEKKEAAKSSATSVFAREVKEVITALQHAAEELSEKSSCAVFLSYPRFDQDFVTDITFVLVDASRVISVILTSFGQVYTEIIPTSKKMSKESLDKIQGSIRLLLSGQEPREGDLTQEEREFAKRLYQETLSRYLVSYANFNDEDIFKTGFSRLLVFPEFQAAEHLVGALGLFENQACLRGIVRETVRAGKIKYWIGDERFQSYQQCMAAAIHYKIGSKSVGAIGVIGPMRVPYRTLFSLLQGIGKDISDFLEKSLLRYKISFRTPVNKGYELESRHIHFLTGPEE
jgi:heat-inducible transcriptional repressor